MERDERGDKAIEFLIEEQRASLDSSKLTPVNQQTFTEWKERRRIQRAKI